MYEKDAIIKFKKEYSDITLMEFSQKLELFKNEYDKIDKIVGFPETRIKERNAWYSFIDSLNMERYKRDKLWEALNGDITKEELEKFVRGVYYGR